MITQDVAIKLFYIKPSTGELCWKSIPPKSSKTDDVAGNILNCKTVKYRTFTFNGKQYLSHRVIWLMTYGVWPEFIDHIDGNGMNNMISNLRSVSFSENLKNRPTQKNNKTGISGISYRSDHGKFVVRIGGNGKRVNVGSFDDFFEACCARKSAERKLGYHLNHGRKGR